MKTYKTERSLMQILILSIGVAIVGCSTFFEKPLTDTDMPRAKSEIKNIKKVGYYHQCLGSVQQVHTKAGEKQDNKKSECFFLFSDSLGNKGDIGHSVAGALQATFSSWQWVNLEPEFSKTTVFDPCYKTFLSMEKISFQKCINNQGARRKILDAFNLDAIVYLTIDIEAKEAEKFNLTMLVPGVYDLQLNAKMNFEFNLGVGSIAQLVLSEEGDTENFNLNSYQKVGNLQSGGHRKSENANLLFTKLSQFLSTIKTKMLVPL